MPYSADGYKMACELVIPQLIYHLERLAPGTAQSIIDSVATEASKNAEHGDASMKEALFIAVQWQDREFSEMDKLRGEVKEDGQKLACLIDEMEALRPGLGERLSERTVAYLEDFVQRNRLPYLVSALIDAKTLDYIRKGDTHSVALRRAREEVLNRP